MKEIKNLTKAEVKKLRSYTAQLHRQCENSCNGHGRIPYRGNFYTGTIDDWAKKEYGHDIQSAYYFDGNEETVFDIEIERLEAIIDKIVSDIPGVTVEFQHDPRGWEVKLSIDGLNVSEALY